MSIERFQDFILQEEGMILSHDTLRNSDLLNAIYHKVIEPFDLWPSFRNELEQLLEYPEEELNNPEPFSIGDEASCIIDEAFDYLIDISPEGYYFGTSEGDGAEFGFYPVVCEEV